MTFSPASLHLQLMQLPVPHRYCVAFSGGVDSHVLLYTLAQLREHLPCPTIHAIHIDHGIHSASADWARHCQTVCRELGVSIEVQRCTVSRENGQSLEAQAREQRYEAFRAVMRQKDLLLMAHHRDDQAETLLLQLLRGSGVKGLAAMPVCTGFANGWLARPMLSYARAELMAYARGQKLVWVDDPSNQDPAFDRNYLRHSVMPVLQQRWPATATTLARAAQHQAEAAQLLAQLARQDLAGLAGSVPCSLKLAGLEALDAGRQRNVLRIWLVQDCGLPAPGSAQLQRIQDELLTARDDATPLVHWPGAEVRRYRDLLYAMPPLPVIDRGWRRHWNLQARVDLPTGDYLTSRPVTGSGLRASLLEQGVEVRFRQGGERVQLPGRTHHHSLKKLFQTWGVPDWQRHCIPLVYIGEELAQVAGFCVCAPFAAAPEEAGVEIIHHVSNAAIETTAENKDNNPGCTP